MGDSIQGDESIPGMPDMGESLETNTFAQILEMDDDEDEREFSKSIVFGFLDQATSTFDEMEQKVGERDLKSLSDLGHFLKGSSATLGLNLVRGSCEKIQNWGKLMDETGSRDEPEESCLASIKAEIPKLRLEYTHVEKALRRFFGEQGDGVQGAAGTSS